MLLYRVLPFLVIPVLFVSTANGQQLPVSPFSYQYFTPFVLNPAISGSKDFTSINMIASFGENGGAQILSGEGRLTKLAPEYTTYRTIRDYHNTGAGGYLFNSLKNGTGNVGGAVTGSFHIPLNQEGLSFLSLGASYKGMYSRVDENLADDSILLRTPGNLFYHNLDLGVYFYIPNFYAGISATNLFENHIDTGKLQNFGIPLARQYFFLTGYKFLLHRGLNIVLEPSVIVTATDTSFSEIGQNIQPVLKLFMMDFCLGASYHDTDHFRFFFQYRFPKLYLGAYFDVPRRSAYYLKEPTIEIVAGIKLSKEKVRPGGYARW